jgi:hypothetical protein
MKMLFLGNHTYINAEHIVSLTVDMGPGRLTYTVRLSTGEVYTVTPDDSGVFRVLSDMLQYDEQTLRRDGTVTRLQAAVRLEQMMDDEEGKS